MNKSNNNMERIIEAFHDLLSELNVDAHEEIQKDICGHELLKDIECNMDISIRIETIQDFMDISDSFIELVGAALVGYSLTIDSFTKMVGFRFLLKEYLRINNRRNKYIDKVIFAIANFDEIEYSYFNIY